ncbi:MAG: hypothetical protein JWL61_1595 [Gemmatimonadetes bacterium]|jgi:hypothetical protein|nr:hypothetical protein [Gemmatimonadota bacterium]
MFSCSPPKPLVSAALSSFRQGDVAARTFEDSSGTVWEVFEVHRASEAPRGVSAGLEGGWLAFVSASGKRRLAPYPPTWESVSEPELEQLCESARRANPTQLPIGGPRARVPRVVESETPPPDESTSLVRDAVRVFAHEARASRLPAIEAMVRLKNMLAERFLKEDAPPETRADASDLRRVRRWFVEAYYFERPA